MRLFSGRTLDSDNEESNDEDDEDDDGEEGKMMKKSKCGRSILRKESGEEDSDGEGHEESAAEHELCDATVKLLRLFANLSINESIGFTLAKRKDCTKVCPNFEFVIIVLDASRTVDL